MFVFASLTRIFSFDPTTKTIILTKYTLVFKQFSAEGVNIQRRGQADQGNHRQGHQDVRVQPGESHML